MRVLLCAATLILGGLLAGQLGAAASDEPAGPPLDSTEAANMFARCAGYYLFMVERATLAEKPAQAEYIGLLANGAKTAAAYMLATQYVMDNPDAPPRPYGSFFPMFEGKVEATLIQMRALAEAEDFPSIKAEADVCDQMLEVQESILKTIRSGFGAETEPESAQPAQE